MNGQIRNHLEKYPPQIISLYENIRQILYDSIPQEPNETLWAKLPSYYAGESFVRIIPFRDHINIEAKAVTDHTEELSGYKITPKGMLQIYLTNDIPHEVLQKIFYETLI